MNISKTIRDDCISVVSDYLGIEFTDVQMDSLLTDYGLATEMMKFRPSHDTMSREQLCNSVSMFIHEKQIPTYGDKLSKEQVDEFFLNLKSVAASKGFKVIEP